MKFWTHPDYTNHKLGVLLLGVDDVPLEVTHGNFKIKYFGYDNSSYLGIFSWKGNGCKNPLVEFYENDILLFAKDIKRRREIHFIIGGDGTTKENTYYLYYDYTKCELGVNNFNDEHIKNVVLGPDCCTAIMSLNDKYFVALYEEMCTFSRFFGLVNKEKLFTRDDEPCWDGKFNVKIVDNVPLEEQIENAKKIVIPYHPYNKARIGLMVDSHDFNARNMEPIESTEDSLIFADVQFLDDDYCNKIFTKTDKIKFEEVGDYDTSIAETNNE